ncbi:MAG: hypothetical protein UT58_C0005G0021 [Microgenomates group bacterium GW2011_GWC1_39_7b]|uniref:Uncharacterized protein n=3 Tax=Candidatus Woeseibacteriota TaxID=1752722 RepID=A0A0G0LVU0_9BACT|nr:MAG: hypothetical protein UT17_C0003G0128 [Candidatus Woesebacteria bacterium GW2011_GWB1_39_10]KKR26845.1 MAG: hypothetical protein UT58_C0005G0021 [Microgenomates group bacterium GW2011_GWC1_39_7b]KKR73184.1 MAG: hypothetical protein UU16_C0028G0006 [Candidatus Woesebacteria bacterium GW2011_GWA2_40_7]KKS91065.1 MAG: hypothetical protein UV66_C0001G0422 [Candidatus Woesebacteria bacterium GW2011_GWA1_43_12]
MSKAKSKVKKEVKKEVDSEYQLISSSDEFFDDCPVCRLMKKTEKEGRSPTEKELEEAFVKANTQN